MHSQTMWQQLNTPFDTAINFHGSFFTNVQFNTGKPCYPASRQICLAVSVVFVFFLRGETCLTRRMGIDAVPGGEGRGGGDFHVLYKLVRNLKESP